MSPPKTDRDVSLRNSDLNLVMVKEFFQFGAQRESFVDSLRPFLRMSQELRQWLKPALETVVLKAGNVVHKVNELPCDQSRGIEGSIFEPVNRAYLDTSMAGKYLISRIECFGQNLLLGRWNSNKRSCFKKGPPSDT